MEKLSIEEAFKQKLFENGEVSMKLEIKFIGFYKLRALMLFINILNLIVIPKRLLNKSTKVIDCHFKIK